ncbi:MAG TPA: hypothetical protein VNG11_04270 [Chloroflexota bacterium]|nr:hypothetical protein [Chloroflexota bacterium]
MTTTITATELAKNLSDVLNRIHYRGERFLIQRGGEPVASLGPVTGAPGVIIRDVIAQIGDLVLPGDDFARDLEVVQSAQLPAETAPWPN